jgi:hypothetical protein
MSPVVEQRVNRLLKHSFFVADNDIRRLQLQKVLEPIIPVDYPTI